MPKRLKLISLHPGVSLEAVKSSSEFEIIIPERTETTKPPTQEECAIMREIDPLGISLR